MATEIIPFNHQGGGVAEMPAHLAALFGDEGNIAARNTINMLSYRGRTWRRVVDGEEIAITKKDEGGDIVPVQIIQLVILDHNKNRSRSFYAGNFEEGKNTAPTCFSGDGITPDASVKEPCAASCATCPNSVKGSKITENNKSTTACSPNKRVAVVPSTMIDKHPPLLLRLAQTSVWDGNNKENEAAGWYAWDQYMDMLRARGAKHTAAVETKVKFDLRVAYPKLLFSASRWLTPQEAAAVKAKLDDDKDEIAKLLSGVGMHDGVAGMGPVIPGTPPADDAGEPSAADQARAATAKAAAAAKKAQAQVAENEAIAAKAAAAAAEAEVQRKAEAKAKRVAAAAAAAAEAARLAAEAEDEDGADPFAAAVSVAEATITKQAVEKVVAEPVEAVAKPLKAAAGGAEVVEGTPAGLASLLNSWDDDE